MKHLLGLGAAIALGIIAAGLNWIWMSGLALPDDYVAVAADTAFGSEIGEDDLSPIPIPGNRAELRESFIAWEDRAILFGISANRNYIAGDVVLHRDILAPTADSRWDVIGPFKLISVGERFKERRPDDLEYSRTDGNNVTIAVDADFDDRTKKLLEVTRTDTRRDEQQPAIVAVQVLPSNQHGGSIQASESNRIVYQTISLDGIANVPRVLLAGDMIRFVIPSRSNF